VRNFQMLIASAVKTCKQCLQTASSSGRLRPQTHRRQSIGVYFLKCTKFGELIPRKITKIVATKCQILSSKCTKFDFGWAPPQTPLGGPYTP